MINKSAAKPATGQPIRKKPNRPKKYKTNNKEGAKKLAQEIAKNGRSEGGQPGNQNAKVWTEDLAIQLGNELIDWLLDKDHNIHLSEFFMMKKRFGSNLCPDLCKKFESFSALIKDAKEIKKTKLLKWAQLSKINVTGAIFDLKCNHGMIETQRVEHAGNISNVPDLSKFSSDELLNIVNSSKQRDS